jgi:hypothetical protein
MEQIAVRPHLDADGRAWQDRQFGAPMTLTDHVEASTGVRLGDVSQFETGRSRRELVSPRRPARFGDPDADPEDETWHHLPAATARTAEALASVSREDPYLLAAGERAVRHLVVFQPGVPVLLARVRGGPGLAEDGHRVGGQRGCVAAAVAGLAAWCAAWVPPHPAIASTAIAAAVMVPYFTMIIFSC